MEILKKLLVTRGSLALCQQLLQLGAAVHRGSWCTAFLIGVKPPYKLSGISCRPSAGAHGSAGAASPAATAAGTCFHCGINLTCRSNPVQARR